jgi:hypothetical protein
MIKKHMTHYISLLTHYERPTTYCEIYIQNGDSFVSNLVPYAEVSFFMTDAVSLGK